VALAAFVDFYLLLPALSMTRGDSGSARLLTREDLESLTLDAAAAAGVAGAAVETASVALAGEPHIAN